MELKPNGPISYNSVMDSFFLFKLTLSFFIGGLWIILATILADKLGSKVGGLISGLPSTALFSLFFISWTQSPAVAVEATTISPIVGGLTCLFLATYASLIHRGEPNKNSLSSYFCLISYNVWQQ